MSCFRPLLGFLSSNNVLMKNNPIKICPWTEETKQIYKEIVTLPDAYKNGLDCSDIENDNAVFHDKTVRINWKSKYFEPIYQPDGSTYRRVLVPCGQCIGCRLDYSREWASRCEMEFKSVVERHGLEVAKSSCLFVTLTYDDEHLPRNSAGIPTLNYDDIDTFIDTLRTNAKRNFRVLEPGIRYYGAGEYGEKYQRPHYHIILFNLNLHFPGDYKGKTDDNAYLFTNKQGDPIYDCKYLAKLWNKGFVSVCFFDWRNAAYTARYVVKKHKGKDKEYYDIKDIAPEKTFCSNRPGIGYEFLENHQAEIMAQNSIQLSNGRLCPTPRYFKKHLKLWYPEYMWYQALDADYYQKIKLYNELQQCDLDFLGYFESQEDIKKSHIKALKRTL